jgi:hypothetical protein
VPRRQRRQSIVGGDPYKRHGAFSRARFAEKKRSESVVWIRGIAGIAFCALGAVWIAQGSGAMHGSGMSGHSSFALLGGVAVVVGLALLVWAARIRSRRT